MHDQTIVRPQADTSTSVNSSVTGTERTIYIEQGTRGPTGAQGPAGIGKTVQTFTAPGTLSVYTGKSRFYCPVNFTIGAISVAVGSPPVGSGLTVDVNRNGTTIFTTQANRPTIASGQYTDLSNTPNVVNLLAGDYLTVDIDAVGSSSAGSDLTVIITLEES